MAEQLPQVNIRVTRPGDGVHWARIKGDLIVINYRATLEDGTLVHESPAGKPFDVAWGFGEVVRGLDWALGRRELALGSRTVLSVPSCYAYGKRGWPGCVPPDATIIFEVEVVGVNHHRIR